MQILVHWLYDSLVFSSSSALFRFLCLEIWFCLIAYFGILFLVILPPTSEGGVPSRLLLALYKIKQYPIILTKLELRYYIPTPLFRHIPAVLPLRRSGVIKVKHFSPITPLQHKDPPKKLILFPFIILLHNPLQTTQWNRAICQYQIMKRSYIKFVPCLFLCPFSEFSNL